MPLEVQGPRSLSRLERDAVNLVFQKSIDPRAISLRIVEPEAGLKAAQFGEVKQLLPAPRISGYDGDGLIWIQRSAFPYAQALNERSTRYFLGDGGHTEPFSAGNMHYLSTLIHECVHHWQESYGVCTDPEDHKNPLYDFTHAQLQQRDLSGKQHASAGQVNFLIAWQLRYKLGPIVEGQRTPANVDLTTKSPNRVGPADRYNRIDLIGHRNGRRIVTGKAAIDIWRDFTEYRDILKAKGCPSHISGCS